MKDAKKSAIRRVCIPAAEVLLGFLRIFRETAVIPMVDAAGNTILTEKKFIYSIFENALDGGFWLPVPLFLAAAAVSAVLGVLLLRHPEDSGKGKAGKICFIVSQVLFVLLFVAAACVHRKY